MEKAVLGRVSDIHHVRLSDLRILRASFLEDDGYRCNCIEPFEEQLGAFFNNVFLVIKTKFVNSERWTLQMSSWI